MSYDHDRWPEHPAVFAMIVWYVAGGFLVAQWFGAPGMMSALRSLLFAEWILLLALPYVAYLAIRTRLAVRDSRERPVGARVGWATTWARLRDSELSPRRVRDLVCLTLVLGLFLNAFSCWKYGMATVRPFSADAALSRVDVFIHGGRPAWLVLQPWLGHPWITILIDTTYETLWFASVAFMVLATAWQAPSEERTRFFVAFVLTWSVLGTGLAYLIPSAGPCYYHLFVPGIDPYHGLLSYLQATGTQYDLTALHLRTALWGVQGRGVSTVGAGIAAMPSMHVALPALFASSTWATRRRLSLAFVAYTVVVLISSVHLGWHYAIDGYLAILLVAGVWQLAGVLTRQWASASPTTSQQRGSELQPLVV
jgi:PAP2 superfamily protein